MERRKEVGYLIEGSILLYLFFPFSKGFELWKFQLIDKQNAGCFIFTTILSMGSLVDMFLTGSFYSFIGLLVGFSGISIVSMNNTTNSGWNFNYYKNNLQIGLQVVFIIAVYKLVF